jgi:hypothetical protein
MKGRPGLLTASAAAVFGTAAGLVGCSSGPSTLHARYPNAPVGGGIETWGRQAVSAPTPSAEVAGPLASAGEPRGERTRNTGWRMGVFCFTGDPANTLKARGLPPWLSAWGYQFEIQRGRYGEANALVEIVPLVVGVEQSVAIPTLSALAAVRFASGLEFAAGPHFSPRLWSDVQFGEDPLRYAGLGLALAAGYAFDAGPEGEMRIPVNLTVVLAADSTTLSVTLGWTFPQQ